MAVFVVFSKTVEFLVITVYIGGLPVTGNVTLKPGKVRTATGIDMLGGT